MSETIKVSKTTKASLLRVAASLQARKGKRVDLDEAIEHLLRTRITNRQLLEKVWRAVPELSVRELYEERKRDEGRAARKFGL